LISGSVANRFGAGSVFVIVASGMIVAVVACARNRGRPVRVRPEVTLGSR